MKPVTVSIKVPQSPDEVFEYLDVLANHEQFTDHFLVDWETSGPERGVGARARMRVKKPGPEAGDRGEGETARPGELRAGAG